MGTSSIITTDRAAIQKYLQTLYRSDDIVELRIIVKKGRIVAGYFDAQHFDQLAKAASNWSGKAKGIYTTVNPVNPELLARAFNRIVDYADSLTTDKDVPRRRILPIDIDAERAAEISSSEAEHEAAINKAYAIFNYLEQNGISRNCIVINDSGNGAHLLLSIDLPNDEPNRPVSDSICRRILQLLALKFDDGVVHVDQTTYNASRIIKLAGTLACKGDSTSERPHRLAKLLEVPEKLEVVSSQILQQLAAQVPEASKKEQKHQSSQPLDFRKWAGEHGITIQRVKEFSDYIAYFVDCPFDTNHNGDSPAVLQYKNGALVYHCFHNSCQNHTWQEYRKHYEPDAYEKKASKRTRYKKAPITGGADHPTQNYPFTDLGNAERLFNKFGEDFHWITERKLFIYWDGKAWQYDTPDNTQMLKMAKVTVRDIPKEAMLGMEDEQYDALLRWALESESGRRLREMINLVKPEGQITLSIEDLDKDLYLFNCRNATIDLRTGKGRLQAKEDLITVIAPIDYDPEAKCPRWEAWLNLIQKKSQPMIRYLQKISGYCLSGETKTDIVPFCHGVGSNGKSTYWTVIRDKIMGKYAYEVDPDVFLANNQKFKSSDQREELANLYGKRLVTATEIQEDKQLTTNLLKAISGGESIHGDRKYERGITYKPTFKVILSGNNEPIVKDTTDGAWRRLKKIPFLVTIPDSMRIDGYEETFNSELSGIFNWLIEGRLAWQKEGIQDPEEVVTATADYRQSQDKISQFVEDCCLRDPEAMVPKKDLKSVYFKWCESNGSKPISDSNLRQRLMALKIREKRSNKIRWWVGIKIMPNTDGDSVTGSDTEKPGVAHDAGNTKNTGENPVTGCHPSEEGVTDEADSGSDSRNSSDSQTSPFGFPVIDLIRVWNSVGRPLIYLGAGENCEDLETLLTQSINERQKSALAEWYQKHQPNIFSFSGIDLEV